MVNFNQNRRLAKKEIKSGFLHMSTFSRIGADGKPLLNRPDIEECMKSEFLLYVSQNFISIIIDMSFIDPWKLEEIKSNTSFDMKHRLILKNWS